MDPARVPILGTIAPGREHYGPLLAQHLDRTWAGHPPFHFALPAGSTSSYQRAIATGAATWTETLLCGLEHLESNLGANHVFMLLEDHVPLWTCDAARVAAVIDIAIAEGLDCVFFTKYAWPWQRTSHQLEPDGRVRIWGQIDIVTLRGQPFARMPRNHVYYNQCQPAIWRLDYYRRLVAAAVERGITDPWVFETSLLPGQLQHYVADYRWPSRPAGYRRRARVDLRALYTMQMPEGAPLRRELLRERFPRLPPPLRDWLGRCLGAWGRLRGLPPRPGNGR